MTQAPQVGAPITVWVKRTDVAGARYVAVKDVDGQQTVDDFIARWILQEQLDVRPSLVTLRLVNCGARKPAIVDEAEAEMLDDPRLTLAAAGLTDGCSLLAFVVGSKAGAELVALSANVSGACIARTTAASNSFCARFTRVWPPQPNVWQTMLCSKRAQCTRTYSTWVHAAQGRAPSSWMQIVRSRRRCSAGSKRFAASGLA